MGNRTRDRVIYIRTDEKLQAEFEKQKEASGYGSNADFIDYLLRVSEGKQADGVTLKDVRNLLSELSAELKKQGVNINQIAKHGKRKLYKLFVNLVISVLPLILYIKM